MKKILTAAVAVAAALSFASPAAAAGEDQPRPPLTSVRVDTDGLGPVKIGQRVHAKPAATVVTWTEDVCAGTGSAVDRDLWASNYVGSSFVAITAKDDRTSPVSVIEVYSKKLRTPHGLGVGSTIPALKKLGAREVATEVDYYRAFIIHGPRGKLVFLVDVVAGAKPRVSEYRIVPNSTSDRAAAGYRSLPVCDF